MNIFANWLFKILLGWTGNALNSGAKSLSSNAEGISSLFSKIWLPLLVLIIVFGMLVDLLIRLAKNRRIRKQRRIKQLEARQMRQHASVQMETQYDYRDQVFPSDTQQINYDAYPTEETYESDTVPFYGNGDFADAFSEATIPFEVDKAYDPDYIQEPDPSFFAHNAAYIHDTYPSTQNTGYAPPDYISYESQQSMQESTVENMIPQTNNYTAQQAGQMIPGYDQTGYPVYNASAEESLPYLQPGCLQEEYPDGFQEDDTDIYFAQGAENAAGTENNISTDAYDERLYQPRRRRSERRQH